MSEKLEIKAKCCSTASDILEYREKDLINGPSYTGFSIVEGINWNNDPYFVSIDFCPFCGSFLLLEDTKNLL